MGGGGRMEKLGSLGAARTDGNGNGLKDTCVSPLQLCNIHGSVVDLTP